MNEAFFLQFGEDKVVPKPLFFFFLHLIKCLFRMVTQDKSCKSSVKTKQKPKKKKKKIKEGKEWQLVLPIKKKTVNHFTTRK